MKTLNTESVEIISANPHPNRGTVTVFSWDDAGDAACVALTPAEARKVAKWLKRAAQQVEEQA